MSKINRGSEWNRWDLHIHTPNTNLNDQFRDTDGNKCQQSQDNKIWHDYCTMLNESGIKCFGITDYFSVDNYLYLKEKRTEFGLNEDIILFPNIELRVSGLVPKRKQRSHNHVNVHIIFAETVTESQLNTFLSNLTVKIDGGRLRNFRDDLAELLDKGGFKQIPDYTKIQEALRASFSDKFKNHSLIMVPNGDDGLSNEQGTNYSTNLDFMKNEVDIIQSASSRDVEYYLQENTNGLKKRYPCISGSDAHNRDEFLNYDKYKSTWIKAEPTFEGLKSIVHEPGNRVKISELNPSKLKTDSKIIDYIKLPSEDFNSKTIYFNDDMNVIIGGRSSGKSLLLSIIGMKASGIEEVKGKNTSYNDLIRSKIEDTELFLRDGSKVDQKMNIEFFYQDNLQEIARDSIGRNNFIGEVIPEKSRVNLVNSEVQEKKEAIDFSRIIDYKDKLIQSKKEFQTYQSKEILERNIEEFKNSIDGISIKFTPEERKAIDRYNENISQLEIEIGLKSDELQRINDIKEERIITINEKFSKKDRDILSKQIPSIVKDIENLNMKYLSTLENVISQLETENTQLKEQISNIREKEVMIRYEKNKNKTPELEELYKKFEAEEQKLSNRTELEKSILESKRYLKDEIEGFISGLDWEKFIKEVEVLSEGGLSIKYVTSIKVSLLLDIFKNSFKTNQNIYKDNVSGTFKEINDIEDYNQILEEDFKTSVENLILCENENIYRSGYELERFLNDIGRLNFVVKDYIIQYEGQDFDKMSEGKKAFVLLLIKLKIGEKDCPILIDQPEDNLDNRSIAKDLVEYLKDEKTKRQIFIVSHNANVAIGADSENIIIANENDEENPNPGGITYYYKNGSLEDEQIKNEVCLILEGGEEAFQARENRYNFSVGL